MIEPKSHRIADGVVAMNTVETAAATNVHALTDSRSRPILRSADTTDNNNNKTLSVFDGAGKRSALDFTVIDAWIFHPCSEHPVRRTRKGGNDAVSRRYGCCGTVGARRGCKGSWYKGGSARLSVLCDGAGVGR